MPATPTEWTALRIAAPPEVAEAIVNFLLEAGATGVVTDDEAPAVVHLEAAVDVAAAPEVRAALGRYLASLAELEPGASRVRIEAVPVPSHDWADLYRRHHRPVAVGRRLMVAPPWDVPAAPGREVLVIEPGMAFGTGQHATTRGCLEALEVAVDAGGVGSVLDVGTGSGILALAAARLGVPHVVALDVDPAVLPLARANLDRNGASQVLVLGARPAAVRSRFAVVVANLLADAIVGEAADLVRLVTPGGRLVVSGLLDEQVAGVVTAYPGWRLAETRAEAVWRTLTLERER